MFWYYIKLAIRNIRANKRISLLNVIGMYIGILSVMLIFLWADFEFSYDKHFSESNRIYRLTNTWKNSNTNQHFARIAPGIMKQFLDIQKDIPEVEEMVRLMPMRKASVQIDHSVHYSYGAFTCDSGIFQLFDVKLLQGTGKELLNKPFCAVLSKNTALKYFGDTQVVGNTISITHQQSDTAIQYKITGVMEDFPDPTHFHPEILLSFERQDDVSDWTYTYLLLTKNASASELLSKFPAYIERKLGKELAEQLAMHVQPIEKVHLESHKQRELEANGDKNVVWILMGVGMVVLCVALLNFINLNRAAISKRISTLMNFRLYGAGFSHILGLVILENMILMSLASLAAIISVEWLLPLVNSFAQTSIALSPAVRLYFAGGLILIVTIGSIFGSYPLFAAHFRYMSTNAPALFSSKRDNNQLFKIKGFGSTFLTVQFIISLVLMIVTVTNFKQTRHILGKRIGKENNNMLNLVNIPKGAVENYSSFKSELGKHGMILDVTGSSEMPSGQVTDAFNFELEGMDEQMREKFIFIFPVDENFLDFYGIDLLAGNKFPPFTGNDKPENYIINRAALLELGYSDPWEIIGKEFTIDFPIPDFFHGGRIIGIVDNFHLSSLKYPEKPLVMFQKTYWFLNWAVKFREGKTVESLDLVKQAWDKINVGYPIEYHFIDDQFNKLYKNELIQEKILSLFSLISILISCLGMAGIVAFVVIKRTKEIGIRKVNGASVFRIFYTINKSFVLWMLLAFVIAVPIAYLIIDNWLQQFVERTFMSWWIFMVSGSFMLSLVFVVAGIQSWRAASRNPVESLRYE